MPISLGNLLTILIVFLVLALYRRLDRQNRSLEKVKRYSDNVVKNLSSTVEQKTAEIRDLSIELQVNLKTGKEVLKRIREVEDGLRERSGNIESIGGKIADYDRVLKELVDMTSRVEENLKRVREESLFVDKVGRRIRESVTRLATVEKEIPELQERLSRENRESLVRLRQEVGGEMETRVGVVLQEVRDSEKKVKDFSTYITRLEARREELQKESLAALRRAFEELDLQARGRKTALLEEVTSRLNTLSGEATARLSSLSEGAVIRVSKLSKEATGRLETLSEGAVARLSTLSEDATGRLTALSEGTTSRLTALSDDTTGRLTALSEEATDRLSTLSEETTNRLNSFSVETVNRLNSISEETARRMNSFSEEAAARMDSLSGETANRMSSISEKATARLNALSEEAVRKVQQQQDTFEEVGRRAQALETEVFEALRQRIGKDAQEIAGSCQALENQLKAVKSFSGELGQRIQEVRTQFEELRKQTADRLQEASREVESEVFRRVEERLADYEGEAEYRFRRLEEVNVDVEALEGNLRQAMEKMTVRLQKEFESFGRIMDERYQEEKRKAEEGFGSLSGRMEELEQGLQELKSQAYQSVSKQLQVFEDEFFNDLKKKNQTMEERVLEWQNGLDGRIMEITQVQTAARESLEKTYHAQMREGLEKVRQNLGVDLRKIETHVSELQDSARQGISSTEGMLKEYEAALRLEVEKVQKEAQELFRFELDRLRDELNGQTKKLERDLADRVREISSELGSGRKALDEQLESTRTEASIWQTKLLQLMKEAEAGFTERLSAYRLEAESSIASIRESFAAQREDLIVTTQEERVGMKNELKVIGDRVSELGRELDLKAETALKSFQREEESFQVEFKRGVRDLQVEMEAKIRDIRSFVGEMKERAEEQQRVVFGRIDEGAKVLTVNLSDIDKRVKSFIVQTKIFERADSLRITLEGRIDELKNSLKEVQIQRKDVQEIGTQMLAAKKMMEDVQAKMTRFMAERRRIEDMDTDFKRLLSISQDVGLRIESLQSSQDALQEIQARIRDMENLEKVIETRYERLEKKKGILDSTTEGVDRSFQVLESLEKMIKSMEGDLRGFSQQAVQLRREIEVLSSNKEKADQVVEKLDNLDGIIGSLENRIEKFETSREWLARTETRFEEVSREAQEQVQLLQSILKKETAGQEREKETGAPPLSKRDQVVKLAHQGWSSKEIAKVTKLSRGEVELILELTPRN